MAVEVDPEGVWATVDKALKVVEAVVGTLEPRVQATLLVTLSNPKYGYWQLTPERQQLVRLRLAKLVPQLRDHPKPEEHLTELFSLHHTSGRVVQDMGRAVRQDEGKFRREPVPGESLYLGDDWIGAVTARGLECEVPLGYYFWSAVATVGAACRAAWYIDRANDSIRLNHYVLLIGKPATGKSVAMNESKDLIRRANRQLWPWAPGEPLPNYDHANPWEIRCLPDSTGPALMRRLEYQTEFTFGEYILDLPSAGIFHIDELGTFLGKDSHQVNQKLPLMTTLHSAEEYDYETVQQGRVIKLRKNSVSMIGCATVKWFRDALSPLLFTGGFMDRTIVVHREPLGVRIPTPAPPDPIASSHLAKWLTQFMRRTRDQEIIADRAAVGCYEDWYRRYPEPIDEASPTVKRRANLVWRVAAILALADDAGATIHLKHMERAILIVEHEDEQFAGFIGRLDKAPEMDHMEFIERRLFLSGAHTQGHMTRSELFNYLRQRKGLSPPNVKAVPYLLSLIGAGRVEVVAIETGGRPAQGYRLTDVALREFQP